MPEKRMDTPKKGKNIREKALTCIHPAYTMADTPEEERNEVDRLAMKNFLNTLADIILSITSRNNGGHCK
jgi:hypothetical protein